MKKNVVNNPNLKTLKAARDEIIKMVRSDTWSRFKLSAFHSEAQQLVRQAEARREHILNNLEEIGLL